MSKELVKIGISEGISSYRRAKSLVDQERRRISPLRSLDIARRFDELFPEASGFIFDLNRYHKLLPIIPPAVVLITDPHVAAELLQQRDFRELSTDTPTHGALTPIHGSFIFYRSTEWEWRKDKAAAGKEYAPHSINNQTIESVAIASVDSLIANTPSQTFPGYWTKYLIAYQVTRHLVGREIPSGILERAIKAHSFYTRSSLIPLILGNHAHGRIGSFISSLMLGPYYEMLDTLTSIADSEQGKEGMLYKVLSHIPKDQRNTRDVAATLVAGLNNTRSLLDFTLYACSLYPEFQERARGDEKFLTSLLYETGRLYPVSPYVVRRVKDQFRFLNQILPKDSLVICGAFAYGDNKHVENANQFDPSRLNLEKMATVQGGEANLFSFGPHVCLARYFGMEILIKTIKHLLQKFDVSCDNNPQPIIGEISLRFDTPLALQLTDRNTGKKFNATSSYT